jgi:hypothetical protein
MSLAVGAAGSAGFAVALPYLGLLWTLLVERAHRFLGLPGAVAQRQFTLAGGIEFAVPTVALEGRIPSIAALQTATVLLIALVTLSLLLRDRWIPLAYFLRALALVQLSSVLFFAIGGEFPYQLPEYVVGLLSAGLFVMGLVPLVLGLTFYFLDISAVRKLALTLAVLGHLAILLPLQALLHAYLIEALTVVVMPTLFLLFGLLLDIMVLVAFYGWAMSWRSSLFREAARR